MHRDKPVKNHELATCMHHYNSDNTDKSAQRLEKSTDEIYREASQI